MQEDTKITSGMRKISYANQSSEIKVFQIVPDSLRGLAWLILVHPFVLTLARNLKDLYIMFK